MRDAPRSPCLTCKRVDLPKKTCSKTCNSLKVYQDQIEDGFLVAVDCNDSYRLLPK